MNPEDTVWDGEIVEDVEEDVMNTTYFGEFLRKISQMELTTNTTSKGETTIQQTPRNELRREGLNALKQDLVKFYGDEFDVVETKEGIVIVAENEPGGWTFSWELKSTIKSLDYDPFLEAGNFDEDQAQKAAKKARREAERETKERNLAAKREAKLKLVEQQMK